RMDELLCSIAALATALHRDRIEAVASALEAIESQSGFERCRSAFGPSTDQSLLDRMKLACPANPTVSGSSISAGLRPGCYTASTMRSNESVDLVWTGPRTGLIPTRKTEQVICEVIEAAKQSLFVVSYVFHKALSINAALNEAARRQVS